MVRETPELYEAAVKPYIAAFPPARTKWYIALLAVYLLANPLP
jgi:m7GpppX diphosphatase